MSETLQQPDRAKVAEACAFFEQFSSIILGSVNQAGLPHTSYAPHITDKGNLYIYVSGLAQHSATLKNGHASLFLLENENQARSLFARKRLTLLCAARPLEASDIQTEQLLDKFESVHGPTVKVLRSLPDFQLFELKPYQGSFVTGFGAAFDMTAFLDQLTGNIS